MLEDTPRPPPDDPTQPSPTSAATPYTIQGSPTTAFINAFYPNYSAQNGQFVYGGQPSGVNGLGGGSITNPTLAADWINSLWDPYAKGNYEQFFNTFRGNATASPDTLASYQPILSQLGFTFNKNAAGKYTDFTLPNGEIIDPLLRGGAGGWQWLKGGGGGKQSGPSAIDPSYLQPFTGTFDPSMWAFHQPNAEDIYADPSYQFRLDQGRGMLENSAASRGLLNSGGTLRDLLEYGQRFGSQEYGNVWNRDYNLWNDRYQHAWQNYVENKDTFYRNQNEPFNKIYRVGSLGETAAAA